MCGSNQTQLLKPTYKASLEGGRARLRGLLCKLVEQSGVWLLPPFLLVVLIPRILIEQKQNVISILVVIVLGICV